jgi:hypothetical protein
MDEVLELRAKGRVLLDIDLPAIGRPVQAMIAVRIRPPKRQVLEAFRDWATHLPQTIGAFVVTGNQDLYAFVIDHLTQRPEVVYEHIRNPRVDPAPLPRRGHAASRVP